ncbi:MAG: fibronectin type III domain-containing protein, partial [Cytophagales bacterium]
MLLSLFFLGSNVLAQDAAPTPPTLATAKVISIFSDKFTNVAGTDFFPNWSQSPPVVVSIVSLSGSNQTLSYANLSYQGVQLAGSVNAANMVFLHVDVYTTDETSLQITPIGDGESLVTLTPLTLNGWNSFDVPLVSFTGVNKSNISQFKFVGSGGITVLLDNLYFWDNTPADVTAPTAFTATRGLSTYNSVELLLNATDNTSAIDYTVSFNTTTINVGGVAGTQKSYKVENLMPSTAYSFTITAKDAAGNEATNNPLTVMATTTSLPSNAPTPAALAPAKVISIFSDAFANVAGTDFYPNWSQSPPVVVSIVTLAGTNQTLSYANLSYQGVQLTGSVNAANMVFLHVDIYTTDETSLKVSPISQTPTAEYQITLNPLTLNGWNSYDIPLTSFVGVDMSDIFQFIFVGSGGKTVLIDNLYFWDNSATVDAEAPTAFVATKGLVTSSSAELLLNANDNTSVINYSVAYNTSTVNVGGIAGTQKSVVIDNLMPSTVYSFSVTAKDATGNVAANNPILVVLTTASALSSAPTPPVIEASKVISIFSGSFSNISVTNFNPNWGQTTLVSFATLAGGNVALKYSNFNYQGTEFVITNVSKLTHIHFDMYTDDLPSVELSIISPKKENFVPITLTLGQWKGYDIPLTEFTVPKLDSIYQLKFENKLVKGKTLYLDNIYFYQSNTTVAGPTKIKPSFPITFEDSSTVNYSISDFAGNTLSGIAADPDNAHNKVL